MGKAVDAGQQAAGHLPVTGDGFRKRARRSVEREHRGGLGATISHATDSGNFRVLPAATVAMAAMVVTIDRLVWRRLYGLASTKFKPES